MAWPIDLSSTGSLYTQINSFATTLNGGISAGAASATLTTTSPLPAVGLVTIEGEAIRYGANSTATSVLSSLTRGFDSTTAAAHADGSPTYANHVAIHHNALKDAIISLETDLVSRLGQSAFNITNSFGDITASRSAAGLTVTINATNSNNANAASHAVFVATSGGSSGGDPYLNFLVTGVTNWSIGCDNSDGDALCVTAASTLNGTNVLKITTAGVVDIIGNLTATKSDDTRFNLVDSGDSSTVLVRSDGANSQVGTSSNHTFTIIANGVGGVVVTASTGSSGAIRGTNTNNNATALFVGEYVESVNTATTNSTGTTQWTDVASISLTAGDWDVSGTWFIESNGATWTLASSGISTTSGNDATGLVLGNSRLQDEHVSSLLTPTGIAQAIPAVRMSLSATTTVYHKFRADFSAGTPRARGRISARRVR